MPRISILMPVRNESRYLKEALLSIFRQTLVDWELIVVDDGSTDDTPDILAAASRQDSRLTLLSTGGAGLVSALNMGIAACSAPLIARMDGDDISHPQRLEIQACYLDEHPEVGLVACGFHHFPRHSIKSGMSSYEKWQNCLCSHESIMLERFVESPFVHPSVMLRKELLINAGGYQSMGWAEDYDLWLRLASEGVGFFRIPDTLFFWRDHPERATRTMDEYSRSAFRACKCHYLLLDYLSGEKNVTIAGAGLEGRAWQRLLLKNGIAVTCWIDVDPHKIGRTLHGAPVISPDQLSDNGNKILAAIGVKGAREQFREVASSKGLVDGLNFICVA
ncbi:glycosyltransferase [Pelotalea chapellei]|uniref:glycosyltransferase n=1 Tax=Pelotalea chapellei TaxID=44671 RepID=UPI0034619C33